MRHLEQDHRIERRGGRPLGLVVQAALRCADMKRQMARNLERELPALHASAPQREGITRISGIWAAAWPATRSALDSLALMGQPDYASDVRARVAGLRGALGDDIREVSTVVSALGAATADDPVYGAAFVLVSEAGAQVLKAFVDLCDACEHYARWCDELGKPADA